MLQTVLLLACSLLTALLVPWFLLVICYELNCTLDMLPQGLSVNVVLNIFFAVDDTVLQFNEH
jgi:hypothetical protein